MKRLIYVISFLVAFSLAAQPLEYKGLSFISVYDKVDFEFNTTDYLPKGFDAYQGMFLVDYTSTEEEIFEFDTRDYLPEDFDPYKGMFPMGKVLIEEAPFDFDTKDYLPVNFNPYITFDNINEESSSLIKFIKEL